MFGIRFIKSQPTVHLMQFMKGRVVRQGVGQSFFYYAPASTVVAVPVASSDQPFMLTLVSADFQSVTVQGKVSYRVSNPQFTAGLLDFSLDASGTAYASEDPQRLGGRVATQVEVIIQQKVQAMPLAEALRASAVIARHAQAVLGQQTGITALGLEVLGVSIQAVKPTPEMARALEAEAREANLKAADDAIYLRRMAALEKERSIRENELDTEVAVQDKQRQIEEARMAVKATVMRKENALRTEQMEADVGLEDQRKAFINGQAANTRTTAEAEAFRMESLVKALQLADPKVLQALASMDMGPGQLIAQAFGGLAEKAERIGQLNMSPELLTSLMRAAPAKAA